MPNDLISSLGGDESSKTAVQRHDAEIVTIAELHSAVNVGPIELDPLTSLDNRSSFIQLITRQLSEQPQSESALIYLSLNRGQLANKVLDFATSDALVKAVAVRIRDAASSNDWLARIHDDGFAVFQRNSPQPAASRSLARRLIDEINAGIVIDGRPLHVTLSAGIAIWPFDGADVSELLQSADIALAHASVDGGGVLRYFEPKMKQGAELRRRLEDDLRTAVANREFELAYQPVMDIGSRRIVAVEALVRWKHPVLGCISPAEFIPLAEQNNLIIPIGEWVLRQACQEAIAWDDLRVAVNVSPIQLRSRNFVRTVADVLRDTGLQSERLELEITETALVSNAKVTAAILHQLRDTGVKIALDDFGTGYSSINYLRRFPFDKIKIDRSFVSGLDADPEADALVKMVAALGVALSVTTTAEGVETDGELRAVRDAGCTQIQGYLLSKPISAAGISNLLSSPRSQMRVQSC